MGIARGLARRLGRAVPLGSIDITLYRDDFDSLAEELTIGATDLPFALDRRTVILVDDVLYTGRTIRAALAVLLDLGRPARIVLVVLIDRGWRELPIAADLVGLTLATAHDDDVQVLLAETDGQDRVALRRGNDPQAS
jgi:pyrimidine operon attenuation protein/uracil phosphoribosyltransferase